MKKVWKKKNIYLIEDFGIMITESWNLLSLKISFLD